MTYSEPPSKMRHPLPLLEVEIVGDHFYELSRPLWLPKRQEAERFRILPSKPPKPSVLYRF